MFISLSLSLRELDRFIFYYRPPFGCCGMYLFFFCGVWHVSLWWCLYEYYHLSFGIATLVSNIIHDPISKTNMYYLQNKLSEVQVKVK